MAGVLIMAVAACAEGELEEFFSGGQTGAAAAEDRSEVMVEEEVVVAEADAAPAGAVALATPIDPGPSLDGRREWTAPVSAAAIDLTVTALDERGWGILWQLVGEEPPGPLPEGAMAVGVFVSARRTDGYTVDVLEMYEEPNSLVVEWVETQPARGAPGTEQVTAPYVVRLLPASDKPVRFVGSRTTASQ